MPNIVNDQIESLLRQAEDRLGSGPSSKPSRKDQAPCVGKSPVDVRIPGAKEKELTVRTPHPQSHATKAEKTSAGSQWFNLPKTNLTPEFKHEWQLLRMRGLLDPKHQKKALRATAPDYSQIGEVIAGPTDFYSARLTRKERKTTLLGEMMGAVNEQKLHTKYAGIQRTKASGKKAFYQKLVSQRRRKQI